MIRTAVTALVLTVVAWAAGTWAVTSLADDQEFAS
jgi:hypothetical protein